MYFKVENRQLNMVIGTLKKELFEKYVRNSCSYSVNLGNLWILFDLRLKEKTFPGNKRLDLVHMQFLKNWYKHRHI